MSVEEQEQKEPHQNLQYQSILKSNYDVIMFIKSFWGGHTFNHGLQVLTSQLFTTWPQVLKTKPSILGMVKGKNWVWHWRPSLVNYRVVQFDLEFIPVFVFWTDSKLTHNLELQDGEADWTKCILGWTHSIIVMLNYIHLILQWFCPLIVVN